MNNTALEARILMRKVAQHFQESGFLVRQAHFEQHFQACKHFSTLGAENTRFGKAYDKKDILLALSLSLFQFWVGRNHTGQAVPAA